MPQRYLFMSQNDPFFHIRPGSREFGIYRRGGPFQNVLCIFRPLKTHTPLPMESACFWVFIALKPIIITLNECIKNTTF